MQHVICLGQCSVAFSVLATENTPKSGVWLISDFLEEVTSNLKLQNERVWPVYWAPAGPAFRANSPLWNAALRGRSLQACYRQPLARFRARGPGKASAKPPCPEHDR